MAPAVLGKNSKTEDAIVLRLKYIPPFDGETLLSIFRAHQLPEFETVTARQYERVFSREGRVGYFRVSHLGPGKNALRLTIVGAARSTVPATDYGLKQEIKRHPEMKVDSVRPWRAYAAAALWKNFAATKGTRYESVV